MHGRHKSGALLALLSTIALSSCAGGHGGTLPHTQQIASGSPAGVKAAPMARTRKLSSSAMRSVKPDADFSGSGWTQIPGSATQAAAAADGSLWVLSTEPSGNPDKYIWHYANGTWTNIPGLASQLAPAPDGSLYVINSGGGTYHYAGGSWTALGGGAQGITVASDGSTYVISNDGSGAIWKNSAGNWSYIGGSGSLLAANPDPSTYSVQGGTVGPNGLFVINASGGIYYKNGSNPYVQFPGAASGVAPSFGGLYVLGYPAGTQGEPIFYYDYSAGTWKTEPGSGVSVSANAQAIYVVSAGGAIYTTPLKSSLTASPASLALSTSPATGGVMQSFTISGGSAPYTLSVADPSVASAAMETDGKTVDVTPLGAGSTTVTVTDSTKTAMQVPVSAVKFVRYGVQSYNNTINDFAPGPDGNIWYTTASSSNVGIGKFAPGSGGSSIYALTLGPYVWPQGIVAGPDGNMWFTDDRTGGVTKMSMTGAITPYPAAQQTNTIVVGPDGNLWFTGVGSTTGIIGKMTTAGGYTEYPVANYTPWGLAVGHDGALWSAPTPNMPTTSNAILRITTTGALTTFAYSGGASPLNITGAPDGTEWFTTLTANQVSQVTATGAVNTFTVPTANSGPEGIYAAQDGTVWFAETDGDKIAKISGGTITEYVDPYGDYPQQIKAGPDGHIWFSGSGTMTQLTY